MTVSRLSWDNRHWQDYPRIITRLCMYTRCIFLVFPDSPGIIRIHRIILGLSVFLRILLGLSATPRIVLGLSCLRTDYHRIILKMECRIISGLSGLPGFFCDYPNPAGLFWDSSNYTPKDFQKKVRAPPGFPFTLWPMAPSASVLLGHNSVTAAV